MKYVQQDYSEIIKFIGSNEKPNIAKAVINELQITKSSKIIEFGCGTGGDANFIQQYTDANVLGIDNDKYVIAEGEKLISILNINLELFPYPIDNQLYDGAYCINLIHLILDKKKFFDETFRILNQKGCFFVLITSREQIEERYINRFFPSLQQIEEKRHTPKNDLVSMLKHAGFSTVREVKFYFDECKINENYYNRLKSGLFSSLALLPKGEREEGLSLLLKKIEHFSIEKKYPTYKRFRTALIAEK